MAMGSESKEQNKCNICDMFVKNMKVHMKLNHKGKKRKLSGFLSNPNFRKHGRIFLPLIRCGKMFVTFEEFIPLQRN